MMEWIESIDRSIVLWINGWNSPGLDVLMWVISAKLTWIPFYLLLIEGNSTTNQKPAQNDKKTIVFFLAALVCVALTDQISVHLFKELIQRYRPSHNTLITEQLHLYDLGDGNLYKGGMYGFISSHAANFAGICMFAYIQLKSSYSWLKYLLISVVLIVCLSRIYLGVHYLSDVLVGALLGCLIAYLVSSFIYKPISSRYFKA